jgi:hypothetical protein
MSNATADLPVRPAQPTSDDFVLGRERFSKISAVEGIVLTREMREAMERFDREGLSAEERRRTILTRFKPAG